MRASVARFVIVIAALSPSVAIATGVRASAASTPGAAAAAIGKSSPSVGYWLLAGDGGVFAFHGGHFGSPASDPTRCAPNVVDRSLPNGTCFAMAATPDGHGYWVLDSDTGAIYPYGDARLYGQVRGAFFGVPREFVPTGKAIVSTPDGKGYWVLEEGLSGTGSIFHFGDAKFFGDTRSIAANTGKGFGAPPVAMAATRDGKGYWEVHSDGGVFAFGDAKFYGSTGGMHLNRPIVAMATTSDSLGYWLVASDGGVFAFGDARFYGSTGGMHLNRPIIGIARNPNASGYWLAAADGGIFAFGGAPFFGSTGGIRLNRPVFAIATAYGTAGTLHGTVVDARGRPVGGVGIRHAGGADAILRTNRQGQFQVVCAPNPHPRQVLSDDPILLSPWEPTFGNSSPVNEIAGDPVPVAPALGWTYASASAVFTGSYDQAPYCANVPDPLRIVLPPAGRMHVTVLDPGGHPMPATTVSVWITGLDQSAIDNIFHSQLFDYGVTSVFDLIQETAIGADVESLRYWQSTTDTSGTTSFTSLSPSRWGYSVWVGKLVTTCSLVNVTPGATTSLTCQVIPPAP